MREYRLFQKRKNGEEGGLLDRLRLSLEKSRKNIVSQLTNAFSRFKPVDEELWERVEEVLLSADVGVEATLYLVDRLKTRAKQGTVRSADEIISALEEEITAILSLPEEETPKETRPPLIVLVVGVNGVGKTTTIAKMAHQLIKGGKRVLLVAADTFRAAAIEQLETWAERLDADVIKHQRRADPAAVVFDAVKAAEARRSDVVLVDTAGRLHTHVNLMEELKKIRRVAEKAAPESRTETLLVIDASTGQNAISQAKLFKEALGIEGIILTKLDGTAKGGIVISIANELNIPIRLVGTGEGLDDLQEFYPQDFAEALLEE
jgi:fused signal recognition particle receptor